MNIYPTYVCIIKLFQMQTIQIQSLSASDLRHIIKEATSQAISEVFAKFDEIKPETPKALLSRRETADLLQITLPTLWKWTVAGRIKCRKIGKKTMYTYTDVMASLKEVIN